MCLPLQGRVGLGAWGFHLICVEEYYFDSADVFVFPLVFPLPSGPHPHPHPPHALATGRAGTGRQRSHCSASSSRSDFFKAHNRNIAFENKLSSHRGFLLWGFLREKRLLRNEGLQALQSSQQSFPSGKEVWEEVGSFLLGKEALGT